MRIASCFRSGYENSAWSDERMAPANLPREFRTGEWVDRVSGFVDEVKIKMPDPSVQSPTDYEIEKFLREYDNPRKMPPGWIRGYLTKSKPQLAIDVIRAFDAHFKGSRNISIKLWILSALTAAQFAVILMLGQIVLEHATR